MWVDHLQLASENICSPLMSSRHGDRTPRSGCPISTSLEIFGDRWSLLVVRDLMFTDRRMFREFEQAGEGIATNVLAERLERLEGAGIITRRADPEDGRKVVYRLTRKGMELAPMLVEMVIWAAAHEKTEAPPALVRQMRTNRPRFIAGLWRRWREENSDADEATGWG
jgi:DNA-binding HxlR family transcriptional regulator